MATPDKLLVFELDGELAAVDWRDVSLIVAKRGCSDRSLVFTEFFPEGLEVPLPAAGLIHIWLAIVNDEDLADPDEDPDEDPPRHLTSV